MANISWWKSVFLVTFLATSNFVLAYISPCTDGFNIGSCAVGLIFLLILTVFLYLFFIIAIMIGKKSDNNFVLKTTVLFSAIYLFMIFLTLKDYLELKTYGHIRW